MPFSGSGTCRNGHAFGLAVHTSMYHYFKSTLSLISLSETVNWLRFSHDGEWIAGVWARQKEITLVRYFWLFNSRMLITNRSILKREK